MWDTFCRHSGVDRLQDDDELSLEFGQSPDGEENDSSNLAVFNVIYAKLAFYLSTSSPITRHKENVFDWLIEQEIQLRRVMLMTWQFTFKFVLAQVTTQLLDELQEAHIGRQFFKLFYMQDSSTNCLADNEKDTKGQKDPGLDFLLGSRYFVRFAGPLDPFQRIGLYSYVRVPTSIDPNHGVSEPEDALVRILSWRRLSGSICDDYSLPSSM